MPALAIFAAAPGQMADRGQAAGGILDSPLGSGIAMRMEAAADQTAISPRAGMVHILVMRDLERGTCRPNNGP